MGMNVFSLSEIATVFIPVIAGVVALFLGERLRALFALMMAAPFFTLIIVIYSFSFFLTTETLEGKNFLFINSYFLFDHLSMCYILLLGIVYFLCSIFSIKYFQSAPALPLALNRFYALWNLSIASMALVIISNNLLIMWFALEMTTLTTTFLIATHKHRRTVEAMWKYLIICSLGLSFALIGILLFGYAASNEQFSQMLHTVAAWRDRSSAIWSWDILKNAAMTLQPSLVKIAFIFAAVGLGTKASLAPMHTWAPDAYGEAPHPVSAIFSGLMSAVAMYMLMRLLPLATGSLGNQLPQTILISIGVVSMVVAAIFITHQKNLKRLLAYSSVEHMGIIAIGIGTGGGAIAAALLHTFNNSLAKIIAFFSAGVIDNKMGTQNIMGLKGVMSVYPRLGVLLFISLLALMGMAPFAIFISKFLIIKAMILEKSWITLTLFIVTSLIIFMSLLKHALVILFGSPSVREEGGLILKKFTRRDYLIFSVVLMLLILPGIWIPEKILLFFQETALLISSQR
ncbi:MAG: hypothetical protein HQK50_01585 [Oligoflexia bacterium]|nr:hypothetical protein [Oligoflexia bacterium]MBF0364229.1 hypothetical protein [Oligoflexia bacterium]